MTDSFPDAPPGRNAGLCLRRRHVLKAGLALPLVLGLSLFVPLDALAGAVGEQGGQGALPSRKPRAPRLLMLDPGHGGHDPGAIGVKGTQEKDVVLDIVRHMVAALSDMPETIARATRDTDAFLPLEDRVRIGEEAGADLFVSVHADSAPNHSARGLSVYTLSKNASDDFAGQLAENENRAGGLSVSSGDEDVQAILFDLAARRTRNAALKARAGFVRAMGKRWQLLERPMRAANFAVLRSPRIPSMLIETGFLSNVHDETILAQPRQRQKIAQIMARELAGQLQEPVFG